MVNPLCYSQSQREYESEQKRKSRMDKKDKKVVESTIALSQAEVEQLEREKQSEQEKLNVVRLFWVLFLSSGAFVAIFW